MTHVSSEAGWKENYDFMNNYSLIYSFIYELVQVHSYKKQLLSYLL